MSEEIGIKAILDDKDFQAGMKRYNTSLGEMNSKTTSTASSISTSFGGIGKAVLGVGATLAKGVAVGAVAAAGAFTLFTGNAIKQAMAMEQQIANIGAVLSITSDEANIFKDIIVDLSMRPDLKVNAEQAGAAIEMLARNGIFVGMSMEQMAVTAEQATGAVILLANATGAEFGTAADIATDAMSIFGIEASEMTGAVDSIVSVTTNSKFTIDDFNLALRNGGAAAADMGISLEEFNAVIAVTAEEMGSGMKAGTGMREMVKRLTPATKVAREEMENLGLIVNGNNVLFDEGTGELKSMSEVSSILNSALGDTRTVMVEVGGRTAEQNAVLGELRSQYGDAEQAIRDYETGVKGITLTDDARNKKIGQQQELMAALLPNIEELAEVRGEMAEKILPALTDQERSAALESVFGATAMGTVLGLMKEGEVVYTDAATAAEQLGVSLEDVNEHIEGGITGYEAMLISMDKTDALAASGVRIDTISGALEIFQSLLGGVSLKVGDAFLPMIRQMVEAAIKLVDAYGDDIVKAFESFADGLALLIENAPAIFDFFRKLVGGEGFGGLAAAAMQLSPSIRPAVLAIANFVNPIIEFVREHADAFIGAFKGLAAVLGAGVIVTVLSAIAAVLGTILSPIGLIIALMVGFGAAWETNFLGMRDILTEFWFSNAKPALEELWIWLSVNVPVALETLRAFWVDTAWPAILKAVEVVWPIILAIFDAYVSYITNFFIPTMVTLYNYWVKTLWPAIKKAIEVVWPIIKGVLGAMADQLVNKFIPALVKMYNYWVSVLWPAIQVALANAWSFIQPILVSVGEWIVTVLIPKLIELYIYWVEILWPAIQAAVIAAWEFISSTFTAISSYITDILIPTLTGLWDQWSLIWELIILKLTEVWESILAIFISVDESVQTNVVSPFERFVETWVLIWETISNTLTNYWTIIVVIFAEIGRWVNENLVPWFVYFGELFSLVWLAISLVLTEVWLNILMIFTEIFNWITVKFAEGFAILTEVVTAVWDGISLIISTVWGVIEPIFTAIKVWVMEKLVLAFNTLLTTAEKVWLALSVAVGGAWTLIKVPLHEMKVWFETTIVEILDTLKKSWDGVWGSLSAAVQTVSDFVTPFIDKVREFGNWLSGASFDFKVNIPDLPSWAIPHSPLPLHTAWKEFGEWATNTTIEPAVSMGNVEPLVPAVSNTSNSTTSISERTDNIFNLTMETQESQPSLRQTFKMMEIVG